MRLQSLNYDDDDRRSSSAEAYLTPVENFRTNWVTLTQHLVRMPQPLGFVLKGN